jgi:hypothetical protein
MSFLFEKSATWRWIVASSKTSKAFYATFAGVCLVVPWVLGHAVMSTTNRSQLELNEELRRRARDDSLVLLQRFFLCKILENIRSFLFLSSSSSSSGILFVEGSSCNITLCKSRYVRILVAGGVFLGGCRRIDEEE